MSIHMSIMGASTVHTTLKKSQERGHILHLNIPSCIQGGSARITIILYDDST